MFHNNSRNCSIAVPLLDWVFTVSESFAEDDAVVTAVSHLQCHPDVSVALRGKCVCVCVCVRLFHYCAFTRVYKCVCKRSCD